MSRAATESPWQAAWRRLTSRRSTVAAMLFLVVLVLLCVAGPWFSSYTQSAQDLDRGATLPSWSHWLGTDTLGRDLATRVLYGGRVSLMVGAVATLVAMIIGVGYGLVSGLAGGRLDATMMRLVDILYAFPFMTFVIILTVVFGREMWLLYAAIGAVEWLTMARIVRGQTLSIKQKEFVEAARASGVSSFGIIRHHVVPNVMGPVIVYITLTVPSVILTESFLSFLGLGIHEPLTSWGVLISDGAGQESAPWLLLFPALLMAVTLFCFNFIGDGLRDALDPKDR